jgi:hypothetical protein
MTTDKNRFNNGRRNDYIIMCDQCGSPCWRSEATLLTKYTGKGGLLVCPKDVDPIDYGIVPYKIRPEQGVPDTRTNNYLDNTNILTIYNPITDFNHLENPTRSWNYITNHWESITTLWDNM